jgi:hypothetical protein
MPLGRGANKLFADSLQRHTTLRHIRRPRTALLLIAAALAVGGVGCGSDDEPDAAAPRPTATEPSSTTSTNGESEPFEGGTEPVSATGDAATIALLERVALGSHEGYDRVVFEFRNAVPGYRVEYVEPPLHQDGSGDVVEVAGNAFVNVRMEPASGFDVGTGEGVLVYEGPRRIAGSSAGTGTVREVVRIGDFEAQLNWAVGLDERTDFRVLTLDGPPRLVIDFRSG